MQLFINNWASSLTLPATASAVQLSVPEADANRLTGLGTGDHYRLTLATLDVNGIETAWEVVRVTGHTAGVLDVLRGQEGTTALELEAATAISARLTQATMETLRDSAGPALSDTAPQPLGAAAAGTSPAASREDHVHPMPAKADIGLGSVDNTSDAAKPVSTAQQTALDDKVDKVTGYGLSEEDYTTAEKSKLAGLESSRFKGLYATLGALQAAHPTAGAGDYADVDAGIGSDTVRYVWDVDDAQWILSGSGAPLTAAQVKTLYESNADTNAFTDSEKTKLGTVASNATANPDTDSLAEGATNQWFTGARVRAVVLTGLSLATSTAVAAPDTLLAAIGKLAARLSLKEQTLTAGPNVTIDRTDPDNPIISASITGGGGGDVVGPASAIANEVALFDGITGKLLKGGGALGTAAATAATDYATAAQGVLADGAIQASEKGASLGVATLDAGGKVPAGQLPSYVDDVLEVADLASLPGTGETGKIYVTLDDSRQYRWSGSAYVQLVASPGTTDNVPEGATNLYHTVARVRATLLTDLSLADATAIAATDTVLQALGKLAARLATAFARANHTGEQATSTVTGLDAALAAKAAIAGLPSRTVTASGAITPSDAGLWLISTSATPITLTIGAEATAAWTTSGILPMVHILQIGAGAVTVTGDGFSVVGHAADTNVLDGAGAAATALWRASNTWSLIGRLVAA